MTDPKVENKKVEPPKTGADKPVTTTAAAAGAAPRTPLDSPTESVKSPTVGEVKQGAEIKAADGTAKAGQPTPQQTLDKHVDDTAKSVQAYNESNQKVADAKPFVRPDVETRPAPTAAERLKSNVEATAKSVADYNQSTKDEGKSTPDANLEREAADVRAQKKESRVAPLTGELRDDPENDSYVTPGKTLAPKEPTKTDLAPEIERAPLVISPLTGEVKPADEVSYPTPGHVRDPSLVADALDKHGKHFMVENTGEKKFGVAPGQQVSLLHANEEMWGNDEAIRNDRQERAKMLADAMLSSDGLRRTRRVQKNLR